LYSKYMLKSTALVKTRYIYHWISRDRDFQFAIVLAFFSPFPGLVSANH